MEKKPELSSKIKTMKFMQRHAASVPSSQTKPSIQEDPPSKSIETSPLRSPTKKFSFRMAWEQNIETIVPPTKLSFAPSECSKSKEKKNEKDILLEEPDNSVNNTMPTSTKGQLKKQKLSAMTSKDKNVEMMSQLDSLIKKQTNKQINI